MNLFKRNNLIKIFSIALVFGLFSFNFFILKAATSIERVSIGTGGVEANEDSGLGFWKDVISDDNRYVVFTSSATNLVASDSNLRSDVFVYDRTNEITEIVSLASDGSTQGNQNSTSGGISGDGRYVLFESFATNLVAGDTNGTLDIFIYDRELDTTERVNLTDGDSESVLGAQYADMSGDARYVVFESQTDNLVAGDTNFSSDIFIRDRTLGTTTRVSTSALGAESDAGGYEPTISDDGRYVAFRSSATNLVTGFDDGVSQIYVKDTQTGALEVASKADDGTPGDTISRYSFISGNGRYVAFKSSATNLVPNDTNNKIDVFVYDTQEDTIERVNVSSSGDQDNGESTGESLHISYDGRYVIFNSNGTNLVDDDTNGVQDIFLHDRNTGITTRINETTNGTEATSQSTRGFISEDNTLIVFSSSYDGFVTGDTVGAQDIFVKTLNNLPSDISLSNSQIDEDKDPGSLVGLLTGTDADSSDTLSFSLTCSSAGVDDSSFTISGDQLLTNTYFNYDNQTSYSICIRLSDGYDTYDENFTIQINEVVPVSSGGGGGGNPGPTDTDPDPEPIPDPILGCTDSSANNYNPNADTDNGSCTYSISGCTNQTATNYDSSANVDDGSCVFEDPLPEPDPIPDPEPSPDPDPIPTPDPEPTDNNNSPSEDGGQNVVDTISKIINLTSAENIVNEISSAIPDKTKESLAVSGAIAPVIAFAVANSTAIVNTVSFPIRLLNLIPIWLGIKRKRRPWGTVYDSITKQPLDPVYLTLVDKNGKKVAETISDIDGRFGFLVTPGVYSISARKTDYEFPSSKLGGKTEDTVHDNLYFGNQIQVTKEDEIIVKNIPMDNKNFNWNEFAKSQNASLLKFYSKFEIFLAKLANLMFYVGFFANLFFLYSVGPTTLNIIVLCFYSLIILLKIFGVKVRKPGYVFGPDGNPMSHAIIKVFSDKFNVEVARAVSGKTGKYYTLLPKGNYYLEIYKKTGEDSYEKVFKSHSFKSRKGYLSRNFKLS